MKRILLGLIVLILSITSCKKDNKAKNNDGLKNITFKVSGFSHSLESFGMSKKAAGLKATALTDKIDVLYYVIYSNTNQNFYKTIKQVSADEKFGTLTEKLPNGNYSIHFIAGKLNPDLHNSDLQIINGDNLRSAFFTFSYETPRVGGGYNVAQAINQDCFYKDMQLIVDDETNESQSITLDRIVGKLQVKIADAIPANIDYVTITADSTYGAYYLVGGIPTTNVTTTDHSTYAGQYSSTQKLTAADKGTSNVIAGTQLTPTVNPMKIIISCFDANDNLIVKKTILNVTCQPNKVTILTGNMFSSSGSGGGGSQITYDPSWDDTPINVSF
ncbi:MAG: hypothetical protein ABIN95_03485 [Mucilaginibacter sp.]